MGKPVLVRRYRVRTKAWKRAIVIRVNCKYLALGDVLELEFKRKAETKCWGTL